MFAKEFVRYGIEFLYQNPQFLKMRRRRAAIIIEHSVPKLSPSERLLEVGSGKGDLFHSLSDQYPGQVFSLDIEDQVISVNRGPQNRVIADGLKMPFQDQSVDYVYICAVLHHIPKELIAQMLKESLRVGKELIVVEDSIDHGPRRLTPHYVRGVDAILNAGVPGGAMGNQDFLANWRTQIQQVGGDILETSEFDKPVFGVLPWKMNVIRAKKRT
mgnify:CR=1 FL=1